jgi:hypothetical protein
LATDILLHLCLVHPSLLGKVIIRSPKNTECTDSSNLKLIKFWAKRLPHSYSRDHSIDLDGKFKELFFQVQILESSFRSGEDIFDGSVAIKSPVKSLIESTSVQEADKITGDDSNHELNQLQKTETPVAHGFSQAEKPEEKSNVWIFIDGDVEAGNLANVPTEKIAQIEDGQAPLLIAQEGEEEKQVDLSGRDLYVCGNLGCDEAADSATAFKVIYLSRLIFLLQLN